MSTETEIRKGIGLRLSSTGEVNPTFREIFISNVRRDGGTQARTGNSEETVALYAEAMRELRWQWTEENAVVIFHDPEDQYWLADGFHRVEAALRAGWPTIRARVNSGTRRDAILYATGANAQHGLRRSRADVRRAIETLLRDEEWVQWSDRAISRKVRCDDKTVASVRAELTASAEIPQIDERTVSRNGSTYQQAAARAAPPPVSSTDPLAAVAEALRRGDTSAAYAAARAAGPHYARAMAAVDARVEGKPLDQVLSMLAADPPVADPSIAIATDKGNMPVVPLRRTAHLALITKDLEYSVTHIATGLRIGPTYAIREPAEHLFNQLAALDWTDGTEVNTTLRQEIQAIIDADAVAALSHDLIARAAACGYTVRAHGSGYRIAKGDSPMGGAKSFSELGIMVEKWEAASNRETVALASKRVGCAHCGITGTMLIGKRCESCCSLFEAQKWTAGSEDMRWRLKHALQFAEAMRDEAIRTSRLIEIRAVAAANQIDLEAPIIFAPVKAPVPVSPADPHAVQMRHVDELLSGLMQKLTPAELRLVYALALPDVLRGMSDADVEDEIWNRRRQRLHLLSENELRWLLPE